MEYFKLIKTNASGLTLYLYVFFYFLFFFPVCDEKRSLSTDKDDFNQQMTDKAAVLWSKYAASVSILQLQKQLQIKAKTNFPNYMLQLKEIKKKRKKISFVRLKLPF